MKAMILFLLATVLIAGCTSTGQYFSSQQGSMLSSSNIQVSDIYLDHVYKNNGQNCDSCRSGTFQGCELGVGFTVRANLPQGVTDCEGDSYINDFKVGEIAFYPDQLEWHDGPYGMSSKVSVFEPVTVKVCCKIDGINHPQYGQTFCTSKTVNALCS
jgi:hypothetical protein